MARVHDSERDDLSDAEKPDLIRLIEQGNPLPEKYRLLLCADKREVEFIWNGSRKKPEAPSSRIRTPKGIQGGGRERWTHQAGERPYIPAFVRDPSACRRL